MIEITSLFFNYHTIAILKGVNMQLHQGERLILSGPSGIGKSTLIRLIAGLDLPSSGEIMIDGVRMNDGGKIVLPHERSLGIVFQEPSLWPHMSVKEHLEFVAKNSNKKERKDEIMHLLKISKLDILAHRVPSELSAGQAERLSIARALAARPHYLIMDEPFANLDAKTKNEMIEVIVSETKRLNAGLLLITHDEREASLLKGQQLWMREGKLWQDKEAELSSPRSDSERKHKKELRYSSLIDVLMDSSFYSCPPMASKT